MEYVKQIFNFDKILNNILNHLFQKINSKSVWTQSLLFFKSIPSI